MCFLKKSNQATSDSSSVSLSTNSAIAPSSVLNTTMENMRSSLSRRSSTVLSTATEEDPFLHREVDLDEERTIDYSYNAENERRLEAQANLNPVLRPRRPAGVFYYIYNMDTERRLEAQYNPHPVFRARSERTSETLRRNRPRNRRQRRPSYHPPRPELSPAEQVIVASRLSELQGTTRDEYVAALTYIRRTSRENPAVSVPLTEDVAPDDWIPTHGYRPNSLVDTVISVMWRSNIAAMTWPLPNGRLEDSIFQEHLPPEIVRFTSLENVYQILNIAALRNEDHLIRLHVTRDYPERGTAVALLFLTPMESAIYEGLSQ